MPPKVDPTKLPLDARVVHAVFGNDTILRSIFRQLPPISRLRLVGRVSRRWDRLLLEHLSFDASDPPLTLSALHFILRRAGPGLRSLDLSSPSCGRLTGDQVLDALETAARYSDDPLALETFVAWSHDRHATDAVNVPIPPPDSSGPPPCPAFSFDCVERLRAACPSLFRASCSLALSHVEELELSLELLGGGGGRQRLIFDGYCMRETLRPSDADTIAKYLSTTEALGAIELVAHPIGDAGCQQIARALAVNTSLTTLQLVDCGLGADAADALASALACPDALQAAPPPGPAVGSAEGSGVGTAASGGSAGAGTQGSAAGTPGGGEGRAPLRSPVSASSARPGSWGSRRSLLSRGSGRLSSSGSTRSNLHSGGGLHSAAGRRAASAGLAAAFAGTTGNWALRSLSLASNGDVGELGAKHLSRALAGGCALTSLDLTSCHVGAAGARALAEALRDNFCLADLRLGLNDLYVEGAKAIAELLKVTSTLRHLDVHANELGDDGAAALSDGLAENNSLTSLVMYDNDVTGSGARALAEALAANVSLERLDLASDDVGDAGRAALEEAMGLHGRLAELGRLRNGAGGAGGGGATGGGGEGLFSLQEHDEFNNTGGTAATAGAGRRVDPSLRQGSLGGESLGSFTSSLLSSSGDDEGG